MADVVILLSADNVRVPVDVSVAKKLSNVLKNMLEVADDANEQVVPVTVNNLRGEILQKVVEWMNHHQNDPVETNEIVSDDTLPSTIYDIGEWDKVFLDVPVSTKIELIIVANYLDIKGLLNVCCKTLANLMTNRTAAEIREVFNLPNGFTEDEEAQIRRENEWMGVP